VLILTTDVVLWRSKQEAKLSRITDRHSRLVISDCCYDTTRYDTKDFNVDSKAEWSA